VMRRLGTPSRPTTQREGVTPEQAAPVVETQPIPLSILEALARGAAPSISSRHPGAPLLWDLPAAVKAAFKGLNHAAGGQSGRAWTGDEDAPERAASPALTRTERDALERFERAVIDHARMSRECPAHPLEVLEYATLCGRIILRYRTRDDEVAQVWRSFQELVRAFLLPEPEQERRSLVAILHAGGAELSEEAGHFFALLLALFAVARRGTAGTAFMAVAPRLEQGMLREALATLERAAGRVLSPLPVPGDLMPRLDLPPELLERALAELRAQEPLSEAPLRLWQDIEKALRGESAPARARSPEEEGLLRHVLRHRLRERAHPRRVSPWTKICPACRSRLSTVFQTMLGKAQAVQCGNGQCARWLVPTEGQ